MKAVLALLCLIIVYVECYKPPVCRKCGPNASHLSCRPCRRLTCRDSHVVCDRSCSHPGCYCNEGYLRNDRGICVKKDECCTALNQQWSECKPCLVNCSDNPLAICRAICEKAGCYCIPGYLKNRAGVCVPRDKCCPN